MSKIKIAMFSFADIENFGDILFSHTFKIEMEKRIPDVQIDFYCPSSIYLEGITYHAYTREKVDSKYDALILAGGEVVHFFDERTWLPVYMKRNCKIESQLPSDTVWDWVDASAKFKAWISVGVRPFENVINHTKIENALKNLDFISVRGALSKKILEKEEFIFNNTKINITPDLGWLFPKVLEYSNSKGYFYRNHIRDNKYVIFQINNITSQEAEYIAEKLTSFQNETGLRIYLLPVVKPWEDYKYLDLIRQQKPDQLELLPNNLNLHEIGDIIVHSEFILCSSLHAAITALADGIPAAIINKYQGTKFQDIFGHQYRLDRLSHDLSEMETMLKLLYNESVSNKKTLNMYIQFMQSSLNDLFDLLAINILK